MLRLHRNFRYLLPLFLFFFNTLPSSLHAQQGNLSFPVQGERVTVTNWGSRCIYIVSDAYFNQTKDSIIAKIGADEFNAMAAGCTRNAWPNGFYDGDALDDAAAKKKLNQLKMYRIATYQHIFNGKVFERYAILRIPYQGNEEWDRNVTWEGNRYFLLQEKDVVPYTGQ